MLGKHPHLPATDWYWDCYVKDDSEVRRYKRRKDWEDHLVAEHARRQGRGHDCDQLLSFLHRSSFGVSILHNGENLSPLQFLAGGSGLLSLSSTSCTPETPGTSHSHVGLTVSPWCFCTSHALLLHNWQD